ncbi:MAG: hypothetical protein JJU02_14965 [Cryomorphaceae bacterium]|nr:hypothetical protein [Cryomorphaceae bacterium]
MIIYGSKAVHLKSEQSKTSICPNCDTQGSLVLSVYRKHAHIFWTPLFPLGKKGMSHCQHCQEVVEAKKLQEPIKGEYEALKNEAKGPLWQFAGLALIAVFISFISIESGKNEKLKVQYFSSPQIGDRYHYKDDIGSYSTLIITSISHDSIFFSPNEYVINKVSQIYKIDKPENYSEMSFGLSKLNVKKMIDSGDIFNVKRD